jgi:hypothetical protein
MLSVNASTGAVWYHAWHGIFLAERDSTARRLAPDLHTLDRE